MTTLLSALASLAWIPALPAQIPQIAPDRSVFVEGFGQGKNTGGWSFFGDPTNPVERIEESGGNPGAFWHSTCSGLACLDTFAPQFRTELGRSSVFTGDYRAKGVLELGVDFEILGPPFVSTGGRPLTLILFDDAGTPDVFGDDSAVYLLGAKNIPALNAGWESYEFAVPSQSTVLPDGWQVLFGNGTSDEVWNRVITGVDQVEYFFGDPTFFFIFQQWEIGADNLRIERSATPVRGS